MEVFMGMSRPAGPMDSGPIFGPGGVLFKDPAFVKSPFKNLPKEVVLMIFAKLGVTDIESMRLVCKSFKKIEAQLMPVIARQLNIPLQQGDESKDIRAFFTLHEKSSFADCYQIIPGNPPIIQGQRWIEADEIYSMCKLINKFMGKYPEHPYIKQFDHRVFDIPDFPECTNFINIARSAMEHLPPGSWTGYLGHYIYKTPDSKIHHYDANNLTDRCNAPEWITEDASKKVDYHPFPFHR